MTEQELIAHALASIRSPAELDVLARIIDLHVKEQVAGHFAEVLSNDVETETTL